jgi:pimeloyl-ACP methyl ester carboxylesterase
MTSATASESIQGLVNIGERHVFAEVAGTGSPTVVLEAGRGGWSSTWEPIWADLVAFTRVVRYDRAGLGRSDPVSKPRTGLDLIRDLDQLLQCVAPLGCILLVGHSIGGLIIRLYAHHYARELVGMVLVDPTHHDSFARERDLLPPESLSESIGLSDLRSQLNQPPIPTGDDMIDTFSCQEQARHCGSLGSLPLVVLTGMRRRRFADIPDEPIAQFYALKWELHQDLMRCSSQGLLMRAEHSGHNIPADEPIRILEAIRMLVDTLRARGVV